MKTNVFPLVRTTYHHKHSQGLGPLRILLSDAREGRNQVVERRALLSAAGYGKYQRALHDDLRSILPDCMDYSYDTEAGSDGKVYFVNLESLRFSRETA
jgi:hypothetical protein